MRLAHATRKVPRQLGGYDTSPHPRLPRRRGAAGIAVCLLLFMNQVPEASGSAAYGSRPGQQARPHAPNMLLATAQPQDSAQPNVDTAGEAPVTLQILDAVLTLMDRAQPVDARIRAAADLGRTHDPRAIIPLIYALGDPEARIQLAVVEALGQFTSLTVEKALQTVLEDDRRMETVRTAAADGLGAQRTVRAPFGR